MMTIRNIFRPLLLAMSLLCLAKTAPAQNYGFVQVYAVPVSLAAGTATNINSIIDVRSRGRIAFLLTCAGAGASTDTVKAHMTRSLDSVLFDSTGFDLSLTLAGTATVSKTFDYTNGAVGFYQLAYVTNGSAVTVSNLVFQYSLNPSDR